MFTRKGALAVVDPDFTGRILVFGDIHGDLPPLRRGMDLRRPTDILLFLGDYADRGPDGLEVIEGILRLMERIPNNVIALMGNHEDYDHHGEPNFMPCTLIDEVEKKRGSWSDFFPGFLRFKENLFLNTLIPDFALCVHGGISGDMVTEDALASPDPMQRRQLLWGDPGRHEGEFPGPRGAGSLFGPDVTGQVLNALGVRFLIRSHEPRKAVRGPAVEHDGRVITTSATGIYGGRPFALAIDMNAPPSNSAEMTATTIYLD